MKEKNTYMNEGTRQLLWGRCSSQRIGHILNAGSGFLPESDVFLPWLSLSVREDKKN